MPDTQDTQTIEISEAVYNALMEEISARGITVDEWIRLSLPPGGRTDDGEETVGERLERKGLIGIIDSSQPIDPASPPHRPPIFDLIAGKLQKQGLKVL
jgi:hypothetical protein